MSFIGLHKPAEQRLAPALVAGDQAPQSTFLVQGEKQLVVFLRHTGCPFAEAMALSAQAWCEAKQLPLLLVTHGDQFLAGPWLQRIGISDGIAHVHDAQRTEYGKWGLGYAGWGSLLHPMMFVRLVKLLAQGIHNRTASGTRWQRQAVFLVGASGQIQWRHIADHAGDLPSLPA